MRIHLRWDHVDFLSVSRLGLFLAWIAMVFPLSTMSARAELPAEVYVTPRTFFVNDVHRRAMATLRLPQGDQKRQAIAAAIAQMQQLESQAARRFGASSAQVAFIRVDLAHLYSHGRKYIDAKAVPLLREALPSLRRHASQKLVAGKLLEALASLALAAFPSSTLEYNAKAHSEVRRLTEEALSLVRRQVGYNALTGVIFRTPLGFNRTFGFRTEHVRRNGMIALARDYLAYAERHGAPVDQIDATSKLAALLVEVLPPPAEPKRLAEALRGQLAPFLRQLKPNARINTGMIFFALRHLQTAALVFHRYGDLEGYATTSELSFRIFDKVGSTATTFEAFGWVYDYALVLKELGRESAYRDVLKRTGRKLIEGGNHLASKSGMTALLVALEVGATGRRGNSEFKEAHALYRELLDEMEKSRSVPPRRRAEVMLELAELERGHGVASAAKTLVDEAYRLLGGDAAPTDQVSRKATVLRRAIAFANGDIKIFEAATRRIWKIDDQRRRRKKGLAQKAPTLDAFAVDMVVGDCTGCSNELIADARRHLLEVLAVARDDELMRRGFAHVPRKVAWTILSSKRLEDRELSDAAERYVETLIVNEVTGPWNNNRTSLETTGLIRADRKKVRLSYLFANVFSETGDQRYQMPHYARLILSRVQAEKTAALNKLLEMKMREGFDYYETRDVAALIASLADGVRFGDALEDPIVSEFFLQEMLKALQGHTTNEESRRELEFELSRYVLPALSRLALADVTNGRSGEARKRLDRAQRIIDVLLEREWRVGNVAAAATLRELAGPINRLARAEVAYHVGSQDLQSSMGSLFRSIQQARFSETGLTILASVGRQIEENPYVARLVRQKDELDRQARWLEDRLEWFPKQYRPRVLADRAARIERERTSLAKELAARIPGSDTLLAATPLALSKAQKLLGPKEGLLVSIVLGEETTFALVTRDRSRAWTSSISAADLDLAVALLRAGVTITGNEWPHFDLKASADLFARLLSPMREEIGRLDTLIVVPSGALESLPFAALLVDKPPKTSTGGSEAQNFRTSRPAWLIRHFALAVLPSVATLEALRVVKSRPAAPLPFVGIANPVFSGRATAARRSRGRRVEFRSLYRTGKLADLSILRTLSPLTETEDEVRTMARLLGAPAEHLFLGKRASEKTIKQADLGRYRILAFATHGLVAGDAAPGAEPGLALTVPQRATAEDDGFLTPSEIARLKLNADLVILSACDTAASDGRPQAEGLSGLARGFFAAGARAVLASHWKIPSEPTVALTTGMIDRRAQNPQLSWAQALRQSMLELADKTGDPANAHPINWAAFIVVGAP